MTALAEAAFELAERLLERGVLIVLQVRRTESGRRIALGIGLLDGVDAVLLSAAAARLLRRRRRADEPFPPPPPRGPRPHNPWSEE